MNFQFDDLAAFVRVAELGTLSAVARERDQPVSQVTRALARLEALCGARLMHRSTHGLSLTDEGDTFLIHARRLLDEHAALQAELTGRQQGPTGWVRVGVSALMAHVVIAPSLASLYARHPGLRLDISADDRMVDMAREGIDVALRTGTPYSDTLVARQIGSLSRALYAAPSYIARHGLPETVEDLARHHLITSSASPVLSQWALARGAERPTYAARGQTRIDNTAALVALVRQGVGISRLVDLAAIPLLRAGELVPVLPEAFAVEPVPLYAVMLRERHRLPKVRACIDHWAAWMERQRAAVPD